MTKLHYAWKYPFLRGTTKQVTERYNKKFRALVYAKNLPVASVAAAGSSSVPAYGSRRRFSLSTDYGAPMALATVMVIQ